MSGAQPAARYGSAGELAEDLERWLEGRTIVARPVSPPVRLWRWARRNPVLASAAASIFILIGAVAFVQVGRSRLANAVERDQLAARSIAVVPFLDLDAVQADSSLARSLAAGLGSKLLALGTVRVISETDGVAANPGAGTLADLRAIGHGIGVRTAMIGTIRQLGNKRRISFRLLDVNTGETFFARTVSINTATPPALEMAHVYAKELFSMLAGARLEGAPVDPVMGDSAAHEFLRAGDELATTVPSSISIAHTCYSRAIELQPKSAIARASFVLGRGKTGPWISGYGALAKGGSLRTRSGGPERRKQFLPSGTRKSLVITGQANGSPRRSVACD